MDKNDFDNKKPIFAFIFILNALIMAVMGVVVWGENLSIAERIVDLCWYVFLVNLVICGIYIVIVILFIIRISLIGGAGVYNKITPESKNYEIPKKNQHEGVENVEKLTFLDFFKDRENMNMVFKVFLIFAGISIPIFIFTKLWYINN